MYALLNPRDRWIRQTIDSVAWFFTKRFTVRSSISAHFALDVGMELLGPEEVLQRGGVEWKAELADTQLVENEQTNAAMATKTPIPNHAVVSSVVPRQTAQAAADGANAASSLKQEDAVVFSQTQDSALPAEILASDTIKMNKDPASAPHFPCTKLYLHLVAQQVGVPIPPPTDLSVSASKSGPLFQVAEKVFGALTSASPNQSRGKLGARESVPIHITLERLYLGGIPATALSMALPMLLMLVVGWLGIRPMLESMLAKRETKHGKQE